jgi:thermitase
MKILAILMFYTFSAWAGYDSAKLVSRFVSWGVDPEKHFASINLEKAWKSFKKRKDVVVAVIDTGVDSRHPFLQGNLVGEGLDFTGKSPRDHHGHGTHIAGIIKSVFPEVKILSLKYYDPKASGSEQVRATIRALKKAISLKVDIINYSAGGPQASKEEEIVLKEAQKKGILVVAAAGNKSADIDEPRNAFYPASYRLPNIITVGSYDENLSVVPSANFGKKSVEIAAPGHRIRSAIPSRSSAYMTGTSQATAFVTGVAALVKASRPELSAVEIKRILLESSLRVRSLQGKIAQERKLDAAAAVDLANRSSYRSVANRN